MGKKMGKHTLREIETQADIWSDVISTVEKGSKEIRSLFDGIEKVVFTGCGSNYYMSLGAALYIQQITGIQACGVPASELLLYPDVVLGRGERKVVVALSRSGETTEVVDAVNLARSSYGLNSLYIGCFKQSTVSNMCTLSLALPEAQEQSVVTTKSHTAMFLAVQTICGLLSRNEMFPGDTYLRELYKLPTFGRGVIGGLHERVERVPIDEYCHFVFLGSGPFYGIACESMLKMKEMALMPSDAFHCLEFRHGPKSILERAVLVTLFLSDTGRDFEYDLIREVKELGGSVLTVCEKAEISLSKSSDFVFETGGGVNEWVRSILYLPFIQMLALHKALARNIEVDAPRNLTYYVRLKG
jgi:glucosamine--fructose-6-phosphate aminotransferase (isomerizing)